jgi:hypothetical protein
MQVTYKLQQDVRHPSKYSNGLGKEGKEVAKNRAEIKE